MKCWELSDPHVESCQWEVPTIPAAAAVCSGDTHCGVRGIACLPILPGMSAMKRPSETACSNQDFVVEV